MTITIGGRKLAIRRPAVLETAFAGTGLSAEEIGAGLRRGGYASHIATALHPFLADADAPDRAELARMIEAEDVEATRAEVIELFDKLPTAPDEGASA